MKITKNLKNNLRKGALFRRYFLHTTIAVFICLLMLGFVVMFTIAAQWWTEKIDTLSNNVRDIVAIVEDSYTREKDIDKQMQDKFLIKALSIMSEATNSDYFITDSQGTIITCKEMDSDGRNKICSEHKKINITQDFMQKVLASGFADYSADDQFGFGKFVVAIPIRADDQKIGAVIAIEDAVLGVLPYILGILRTITITIAIGFVICFFTLYFMCKRIITPISEMQEVTKHFAKGEFEHRANENYEQDYHRDFARALNRMADELAVEEEARKNFVANVSHELKTPMTTIGGFIDGILDKTIPKDKQDYYLIIVSNEVKRLSRMVVSMLNLSKIEAGEINLSPKLYEISSQLFETMLLFESKINDKHIDVEGFEEMGSVYVTADKDLVQQVIYNLLDNAVKFTPENGKIYIFAEEKNDITKVRIRNTGKGISEKEISRIFERFYKVDKSRSFDVKGVGLGLYIVKTIVNMHGGDIYASSVEGEYTEFAFEIKNKQ